jgi:hypothetical protein
MARRFCFDIFYIFFFNNQPKKMPIDTTPIRAAHARSDYRQYIALVEERVKTLEDIEALYTNGAKCDMAMHLCNNLFPILYEAACANLPMSEDAELFLCCEMYSKCSAEMAINMLKRGSRSRAILCSKSLDVTAFVILNLDKLRDNIRTFFNPFYCHGIAMPSIANAYAWADVFERVFSMDELVAFAQQSRNIWSYCGTILAFRYFKETTVPLPVTFSDYQNLPCVNKTADGVYVGVMGFAVDTGERNYEPEFLRMFKTFTFPMKTHANFNAYLNYLVAMAKTLDIVDRANSLIRHMRPSDEEIVEIGKYIQRKMVDVGRKRLQKFIEDFTLYKPNDPEMMFVYGNSVVLSIEISNDRISVTTKRGGLSREKCRRETVEEFLDGKWWFIRECAHEWECATADAIAELHYVSLCNAEGKCVTIRHDILFKGGYIVENDDKTCEYKIDPICVPRMVRRFPGMNVDAWMKLTK